MQVFVYKKPVDVDIWISKTAAVLIISYDTFSALRKKSLGATLKAAGSEPTLKVTPTSVLSSQVLPLIFAQELVFTLKSCRRSSGELSDKAWGCDADANLVLA